jgi:tripartite ATP-independent transporter DctM subunit
MGLALMIMIYIYSIRFNYPKHARANLKQLYGTFAAAIPPLITPLILVGGILGGIFTPTEAGAVAALYALFLGIIVYRTVDLAKIWEVFLDSSYTTAAVMLIVIAASLFGWVLTLERIPVVAGTFILSLTQNKIIILLITNLFLFFVGCFLEPVAAMIILIPVFLPICQQLEINLVHFGIIMVLNLMIGLLTPPVGLVLYVIADIAKISFEEVVRGTLPFLLPLIAVLFLLTYWPYIVLILPRLLNLL